MTRRCVATVWCGSLLCLLLLWSKPGNSGPEAKVKLAVVTQKASPLERLSARELKRLYLGEHVAGPDGQKLVPLNQAARSPDRVGFERVVLGMSEDEASRFWIDRKIRGQPGPPKAVPSPELLRRAVASLAGTITYLRASDVGPDLKIVKIDDKGPTDAGYSLQY